MSTINTGVQNKLSAMFFFAINAIIMVPELIRNLSLINGAVYLFFAVILIYFMFGKSDSDGNAAGQLAFLVFIDILIICGVIIGKYWEQLKDFKSLLPSVSLSISSVIWLAVGCLIIRQIYIKARFRAILTWLVLEVIMLGTIILNFGVGTMQVIGSNRAGVMLAIFYTAVSVLWFFTVQISECCAESAGKKIRSGRMTLILFALFYLGLILLRQPLMAYMDRLPEHIQTLTENKLSWYFVTAMIAVALVGTAVMDKYEKGDAKNARLLTAVAGFVGVLKIATAFYFTYNWIFVLGYLIMALLYVRSKTSRFRLTLHNEFGAELFLIFAPCLMLGMYFLSIGLWGMCAVTVLWLVLMVAKDGGEDHTSYWIYLLVGAAAESAAWMFHMRNLKDNFVAAAVVLIFAVLTIVIDTWPHPSGLGPKNKEKFAICAAAAILLLIPCVKGGSSVRVEQSKDKATVSFTAEARGKENKVEEAYYYFVNGKGKKVSEEKKFSGSVKDLTMENECLNIVTVDKQGVKTVRKVWYPYGFCNIQDLVLKKAE